MHTFIPVSNVGGWGVGVGVGVMGVGEGEGGCKTHLVAGVQYIKNQFGILPHMWGTLPF